MSESKKQTKRNERLGALFFLAIILFSYTLLSAFDDGFLFGLPTIFIYIFLAWGLIIFLIRRLLDREEN